jgi:hypothetical protein
MRNEIKKCVPLEECGGARNYVGHYHHLHTVHLTSTGVSTVLNTNNNTKEFNNSNNKNKDSVIRNPNNTKLTF